MYRVIRVVESLGDEERLVHFEGTLEQLQQRFPLQLEKDSLAAEHVPAEDSETSCPVSISHEFQIRGDDDWVPLGFDPRGLSCNPR